MQRRTLLKAAAGAAILAPLAGPFRVLAQDGDTLTVAIVSDPVTLDPARMASFFELSVQYNVHEPLLHMTPELAIEPGLVEVAQPDGLTYRLTLREGLTFHDGSPLDAAAVKANFDRMLDPALGSPRRGELGPVASIEADGARDVVITMSEPYAPFLQVLANRAGMMVSPSAVQTLGDGFQTQAVGAGPYRVASWEKNAELVLEAFDGYWRGAPAIRRVVFRPIADETVRLTNLRSGTVQLIDGVPPQSAAALRGDASLRLQESASLGFNAFSFNTTRAPFDDPAVRRAFAAAVDPATVLQAAYFGTGAVSHGPIPPSIGWAFDPELAPERGDAAAAKALLAEAGKTEPVPVTITVTNSPVQVRTAEIMQAQANQAGFAVQIQQIDSTSLITVLRARDFDLCMSPWSGRSDPDGNMFNYFTKDGSNNFPGWQDDETDALLREARSTIDQTARAALYREAQRRISAAVPILFLTFPAILQASVAAVDWPQYPDGALRLQFATRG